MAPAFRVRLADGTDYALPGKLNFVDATLDSKSGTLQIRISVPNPDRLLRPDCSCASSSPPSRTRMRSVFPNRRCRSCRD
jgi:hypothetical protein